ncbi:MAG: DUF177 domain-containing protein [bacterium]|nr:DUF177 domain-containing protein [Candidatus Kapabacteria bacterium]
MARTLPSGTIPFECRSPAALSLSCFSLIFPCDGGCTMANGGAKERAAMVLRISGLPDGEQPIEFEVDATELDLPRFEGPIRVSGTLRKVSTQVFVQGEVNGTFTGECDRCLAVLNRSVVAPLNVFFQVSQDARDVADDDPGVQLLLPDQDKIVLDDEVRQVLMLEVPLKVLCVDDCAGICAGCGVNLNSEKCQCEGPPVDPRWAKLADLYKKDENN